MAQWRIFPKLCALQVGSPPTELLWSPRIAASRGSSAELAQGAFSTQQTPLRGDSLEGSSYPASPKVSHAASTGRAGSEMGMSCMCTSMCPFRNYAVHPCITDATRCCRFCTQLCHFGRLSTSSPTSRCQASKTPTAASMVSA